MHEVLVNRLGRLSLPRKSVVRLTDRPDMTLDAYRGRKTTVQQQQQQRKDENIIPPWHTLYAGGINILAQRRINFNQWVLRYCHFRVYAIFSNSPWRPSWIVNLHKYETVTLRDHCDQI